MKVAHGQELRNRSNRRTKPFLAEGVDNFHISAGQPRRIARLSILSCPEESPIYQSGRGQLPSEDRDPVLVDVWIANLLPVCWGWSLVGWQRLCKWILREIGGKGPTKDACELQG